MPDPVDRIHRRRVACIHPGASLAAAGLALGLIAACGPAPAPPGSFEQGGGQPQDAPADEALAPPPATPLADAAALERFLDERGVSLRFDAETEMDYLPGPARVYEVEQGDSLELHVYPTEAEAEAAAALIRPDARWIEDPTDPAEPWYVDWKGQPQAYRAGRMLAIYVGREAKVLRALEAALGPPFAGG